MFEITTHGEGYGGKQYPAINIKVHAAYGLFDNERDTLNAIANAGREDELTPELLKYVTDDAFHRAWEMLTIDEIEYLQYWANGVDGDPIFPGQAVKLYTAGRSGGWLIVDGLPDVAEWSHELYAQWLRFEEIVRDSVKAFPENLRDFIVLNINHHSLINSMYQRVR